jgi:hypothetical protein
MVYDDKQAWNDAEQMGMTIYYIFLLKKGPTWSPDSTPRNICPTGTASCQSEASCRNG